MKSKFGTAIIGMVLAALGAGFSVASHASPKFIVEHDGPVTAYFAGATASYHNLMNANFEDSEAQTPFVDNRGSVGDAYDFGMHTAGAQVIIYNHVLDTGNWFYTNTPFNDDGANHFFTSAFKLADGTPALYVGTEDIAFGSVGYDGDFNDNSMILTNVAMLPVPEPSTYLMMLLGLGIVGVVALREARSTSLSYAKNCLS